MTQREIFESFMSHVWDGGPSYDKFYDAVEVADAMGAKAGPPTPDGDCYTVEYLFPDGSRATVTIRDGKGSAVA